MQSTLLEQLACSKSAIAFGRPTDQPILRHAADEPQRNKARSRLFKPTAAAAKVSPVQCSELIASERCHAKASRKPCALKYRSTAPSVLGRSMAMPYNV